MISQQSKQSHSNKCLSHKHDIAQIKNTAEYPHALHMAPTPFCSQLEQKRGTGSLFVNYSCKLCGFYPSQQCDNDSPSTITSCIFLSFLNLLFHTILHYHTDNIATYIKVYQTTRTYIYKHKNEKQKTSHNIHKREQQKRQWWDLNPRGQTPAKHYSLEPYLTRPHCHRRVVASRLRYCATNFFSTNNKKRR